LSTVNNIFCAETAVVIIDELELRHWNFGRWVLHFMIACSYFLIYDNPRLVSALNETYCDPKRDLKQEAHL
jgi:hypothetical protein